MLSFVGISQIELVQIESKKDATLQNQFSDFSIYSFENFEKESFKNDRIQISVPISKGKNIQFQLSKNNITNRQQTQSYKITENAKLKYPELLVSTFDGIVEDDADSRIKVVMGKNYFSLYGHFSGKNWAIESVQKFDKSAPKNHYILYAISDLKSKTEYQCQRDKYREQIENQIIEGKQTTQLTKNVSCKLVEISMVADFKFYESQNYDFETTIGELSTILNVVETDYSSLSSGGNTMDIEFNLVELAVSVCELCDPWTLSTNGSALLDDFNYWAINGGLERSFDIAGLMSGRTYDNNLVGLANHDRACENGRTFIIRNFSDDIASLRVMTSHEIGHNFGCVHNYELGTSCAATVNRDRLIMDPSVSRKAETWSNGTQTCAQNSLQVLIDRASTLDCLGACGNSICDPPSNLRVQNLSKNNLVVNWSGTASSYDVKIEEIETGNIVFNSTVQGNSLSHTRNINLCNQYYISIESNCGNSKSLTSSYITSSPSETNIDILGYNISSCIPGDPGIYDLQLIIEHNGGNSNGIEVEIDGIIRNFVFDNNTNGLQTLNIPNLPNTGNKSILIHAKAVINNDAACNSSVAFNIPSSDCGVVSEEKFDFCKLPYNWTKSSSNTIEFFDPFEWKFADNNRNILNYELGPNANTAKTLDGTCMAYFDDDVTLDPSYTGEITLTSPAFSVGAANILNVSFGYNFHKFEEGKSDTNNSKFYFDVYDGSRWVQLYEDTDDHCQWFAVWGANCLENVELDLTTYANDNLKVRFRYSDGNDGKWAGMIALDNFQISSTSSVVLPLDFASLDGQQVNNNIDLEWITYNEIGINTFLIERSIDGIEFEEIGRVSANNNKENTYSFTDKEPKNGANLYKVSAVDFQNKKENAQFTSVNFISTSSTDLQIYPNPVSGDYLHLNWKDIEDVNSIEIVDMTGKIIQKLNAAALQNNISNSNLYFNVKSLTAGTYLLHIETKNRAFVKKIIKL